MVASIAALAAALAVFFLFETDPPAAAQPGLRHCDDERTATACIRSGQFDGVITIGPDREPIVPRYELTPGVRP